MIPTYLEKGFAALLVLILLFNMSQRKHLKDGEKKRFASLYFAIVILAGFAGTVTVRRLALHPVSLAFIAAIMVVLAVLLRRRIFIFRFSCPECGARYPVRDILFVDEPACRSCQDRKTGPDCPATAAKNAAPAAAAQDSSAAHAPVTPAPPTAPGTSVSRATKVADIDWDMWKYTEEAVLCYIVTGGQVLLMHKKTGLGTGKINAPGGRIEKGETPMEAAVRETQEEVGLTPHNLEKRMDLHFIFTDGYSLKGYVFFADSCMGTPVETREADPFWCPVDETPYDRMWADDSVWLSRAMAGEHLEGFFIFDDDTMLDQRVIPAGGGSPARKKLPE